MNIARKRFGKPLRPSSKSSLEEHGEEAELVWRVSTDRIGDVLDSLEQVPACSGGEWAPVYAHFSFLFRLRHLVKGTVIPNQGKRFYPLQSSLSVHLQRRCWANLDIILPFDEPNETVADYVVALQEHAPVWLDPRYFDHVVPAPDNSRFHRRRLPPEWIGVTTSGALRLDASKSGITPVEPDLPTDAEMAAEDRTRDDAPFHKNYLALATALREHSLATVVVHGAADTEYMLEQIARPLEMPLHVVKTEREQASIPVEETLRAIVSGLHGRRSMLLLVLDPYGAQATNAALLSHAAERVLLGLKLPPALRLIVSVVGALRDVEMAAWMRWFAARQYGFATSEQLSFLQRQLSRTGWSHVRIEVLPMPGAQGEALLPGEIL